MFEDPLGFFARRGNLRHLSLNIAAAPSQEAISLGGARRLPHLTRSVGYWIFFTATFLFVVAPIPLLVYGSFHDSTTGTSRWTLANWQHLVSADTGSVVLDTLAIGFACALASTAVGASLAWFLERTDVALSRLCTSLTMASFALPGFILAMSWIILGSRGGMINAAAHALFGPRSATVDIYSPQGLIFVLTIHLIPVSFLSMRGPIHNLDASLEEAASMCGASSLATAAKIVIPLLVYPIGSSFLLSFVLAIEQFAIPAMIGIPNHLNVLSTELYVLVAFQPPRQGAAAALGLLLAALTSSVLYAHRRLTRRPSVATLTGKSYRRIIYSLRWAKLPMTLFCFMPSIAGAIIPLAALIYAALTKYPVSNPFAAAYTFRSFASLYRSPATMTILTNTVVVCGLATVLTASTGFAIAYLVQRSGRASAALLQSVGSMPFGIPGVVIGLGFLWSYVYLPIYGTLWALISAFSVRYLPYAMETSGAALRQLDQSLEEAADVAGARPFAKITRIILPLLRPALQSAGLLLFATFVREISAAALLYTPGTQVLSISIWTSFENADWGRASVLSLIAVVLVLVMTAAASDRNVTRSAG